MEVTIPSTEGITVCPTSNSSNTKLTGEWLIKRNPSAAHKSHTHPNTPNHTALPQTRTPTQPPTDQLTEARRIWADLNDNLAIVTPEGDLTPPPKMVKHAPSTSSSTVNGQPERSNDTKQRTARARWMDSRSKLTTQKLMENMASQEHGQNSTTDHTNHSPGTLRMPVSVLETMMLNKQNATPTLGCMVQV